MKHELSDVQVGGIVKFVIALTALTAATFVLMVIMWKSLDALESAKEQQSAQRGPMARTERERLPPEPRLQLAPGFGVALPDGQRENLEAPAAGRKYGLRAMANSEYIEVRHQWDEQLANGGTDPGNGTAIIPIDEAISRVLQDKKALASRAGEGASTKLEDYAASLPTSASSGRMTEQRKQ